MTRRRTGVACRLEGCVFRQGELAMRDQNCWPGQVSLALGQLDLNAASERVDAIGHRQWCRFLIMETSCSGSGDRTGTAGVGLTDAAFIDTHGDVVRPKLTYELQVYSVRELLGWIPAGRCMQLQRLKVVNKADRMRIANIGHKRFEFGTVSRSDNHRSTPDRSRAHIHADPAIRQSSRNLEAVPRGDFDDWPTDQVLIEQVADEDSDSVAAHLRDRSISVAIVHEPQGTVAFPTSDMLGKYCAKQPIGANAGAPIADETNFSRFDLEHGLPIEDEDKVVLCAVSLRERPPAHTVSVASPLQVQGHPADHQSRPAQQAHRPPKPDPGGRRAAR
jgi:hypothetical protein